MINTQLCCVVLCCVVLCCVVFYCVVMCCVVLCCVVLYYVVLCYVMLCCVVLCCVVLCCVVLCCVVLCYVMLWPKWAAVTVISNSNIHLVTTNDHDNIYISCDTPATATAAAARTMIGCWGKGQETPTDTNRGVPIETGTGRVVRETKIKIKIPLRGMDTTVDPECMRKWSHTHPEGTYSVYLRCVCTVRMDSAYVQYVRDKYAS